MGKANLEMLVNIFLLILVILRVIVKNCNPFFTGVRLKKTLNTFNLVNG